MFEKINDEGINYIDMINILDGIEKKVYIDQCHVNEPFRLMIAKAVILTLKTYRKQTVK